MNERMNGAEGKAEVMKKTFGSRSQLVPLALFLGDSVSVNPSDRFGCRTVKVGLPAVLSVVAPKAFGAKSEALGAKVGQTDATDQTSGIIEEGPNQAPSQSVAASHSDNIVKKAGRPPVFALIFPASEETQGRRVAKSQRGTGA
jgi:hypothetical protein